MMVLVLTLLLRLTSLPLVSWWLLANLRREDACIGLSPVFRAVGTAYAKACKTTIRRRIFLPALDYVF